MWTEFDIATVQNPQDLKRAFAETFGVSTARVYITDDIRATIDRNAQIVVEHHRQPGEFPQRLLIVLKDPELTTQVGGDETSIESYAAMSLFAENMKVAVLAPHRGHDPYAAVLIEPGGNAYHVDLDADYQDETGGVKIVPDANRTPDPRLSHLVQHAS